MKTYSNVTILDHPLIRHKIAILRDVNTRMKEFRELVEEITTLMVYESFKHVPTKTVMVQTPLELTEQTMVADNAVAVVPILRAGLGMVNGVHTLFPPERTRLQEDYAYEHNRRTRRHRNRGGSASRRRDIRLHAGPLPERTRLHPARARRCGRPPLRHQMTPSHTDKNAAPKAAFFFAPLNHLR